MTGPRGGGVRTRGDAPAAAGRAGAGTSRLEQVVLGSASGLVPLIIYWLTLHPGLAAGDSGELAAAAWTGGVAHPPGYPIFTMLAGAWAKIVPWGEVAWRLNLFSAVCAAAAAALLARAIELAAGSRLAGVLGAWTFAFSMAAWKYAIVCEVFALNALFAAAVLLALVAGAAGVAGAPARSHRGGAPGGAEEEASRARRAGIALAALAGLAVGHHHTLLLFALPAWGVVHVGALRRTPRRRVRLWAGNALAMLAGLSPLARLPWASRQPHALAWGDATTWRGALSLVSRADYGSTRLVPAGAGIAAGSGGGAPFLAGLPGEMGWVAIVLAAIGVYSLRRRRALLAALAGYALLQGAFFARMGLPADVPWLRGVAERFHILPDLVLAFLGGLGIAELLGRIAGRAPRARAVAALLLAAFHLASLPQRFRVVDQRGNRFVESLGRGILASLPPRSVLFTRGDLLYGSLQYLVRVRGLRPDVTIVDQELLSYDWYVRRLRRESPGLMPPLGRSQRITLRDGRVVEGLVNERPDGTRDLLTADGERPAAAGEVISMAEEAPGQAVGAAAGDRERLAGARASADRYSGLPGTRNLLWLDHLAGRRPVAFLGTRDDSYRLHYVLTPQGFVTLATPAARAPGAGEQLDAALAALEATDLEPYFRAYEPNAMEPLERHRFAAVATRTALLCCQRGAERALLAHPAGRERLDRFLREFEALDPSPDPACLRAAGFLRAMGPGFTDRVQAKEDLGRYLESRPPGAPDAEAERTLAELQRGPGGVGPGAPFPNLVPGSLPLPRTSGH